MHQMRAHDLSMTFINDSVNKINPTTTEIVYTWPDGREEVRYRRSYNSEEANMLVGEIADLIRMHGAACPYSWRHV